MNIFLCYKYFVDGILESLIFGHHNSFLKYKEKLL